MTVLCQRQAELILEIFPCGAGFLCADVKDQWDPSKVGGLPCDRPSLGGGRRNLFSDGHVD